MQTQQRLATTGQLGSEHIKTVGWQVVFPGGDISELIEKSAPRVRYVHETLSLTVALTLGDSEARHILRWPGGLSEVSFLERKLRLWPVDRSGSREDVAQFVLDQILPRVLAHEGMLVLHAGAVAVDSGMMAFLGPSGIGKSTLVASLSSAGFRLLGDDVVLVAPSQSDPKGRSLVPSLRLLGDSLLALFPHLPKIQPNHRNMNKRRMAVSTDGEETALIPVKAAFVLVDATDNDGIDIRRMTPSEACMAVIANSFSLDPTDMPHNHGKLLAAIRFVGQVPFFELAYPRRYERLHEVHDRVVDTVDQQTT